MGLHRAFVGFSSTDISYYRLMCAWKRHEHIDFNFTDCQLVKAIRSNDEAYIKRLCRERINMSGTFISLIGSDTKSKHKYVRWEIEVALEKKCRIIVVNLDGSRQINPLTCPPILKNIGAIFIPFSAKIIAYALKNYKREESNDYYYLDRVYKELGYN